MPLLPTRATGPLALELPGQADADSRRRFAASVRLSGRARRFGGRACPAAIEQAFKFLRVFPFACRKASPEPPFLREMLIEFGSAGYVALYEIETGDTVTILAVRHQREDDFH